MSNYRRLISYIYAYEGGVKGKNIGFAKIETKGDQCKIVVNVKKVYIGSSDIGVFLLSSGSEILLGKIFIRNGCGEFRTLVKASNIEQSGYSMDQCYGLTVHEVENAWQSYTTIWEDAVAHAAEIELEHTTSEKQGEIPSAVQEQKLRSVVKEIEEEVGRSCTIEQEKSVSVTEENVGIPEPVPVVPMESSGEWMPDVNIQQENARRNQAAEEVTEEDDQPCPNEWYGSRIKDMYNSGPRDPYADLLQNPYANQNARQGENGNFVHNTYYGNGTYEAGAQPYYNGGWQQGNPVNQNYYGWNSGSYVPPAYSDPNYQGYQGQSGQQPQQMYSQMPPYYAMPQGYGEQTDTMYQNPVQNPYGENADQEFNHSILQPNIPVESEPSETVENPQDIQPVIHEEVNQNQQPPIDNTEELERLAEEETDAQEEKENQVLWEELKKEHAKIMAFEYENGCEILTIKPRDIGLLPRENWVFGNNSFLLHGYYNYRYLILAQLKNPDGEPRYLLGVPGNYYNNEKYMAAMFGFPYFVQSKNQPVQDGRFGYWYVDVKLENK